MSNGLLSKLLSVLGGLGGSVAKGATAGVTAGYGQLGHIVNLWLWMIPASGTGMLVYGFHFGAWARDFVSWLLPGSAAAIQSAAASCPASGLTPTGQFCALLQLVHAHAEAAHPDPWAPVVWPLRKGLGWPPVWEAAVVGLWTLGILDMLRRAWSGRAQPGEREQWSWLPTVMRPLAIGVGMLATPPLLQLAASLIWPKIGLAFAHALARELQDMAGGHAIAGAVETGPGGTIWVNPIWVWGAVFGLSGPTGISGGKLLVAVGAAGVLGGLHLLLSTLRSLTQASPWTILLHLLHHFLNLGLLFTLALQTALFLWTLLVVAAGLWLGLSPFWVWLALLRPEDPDLLLALWSVTLRAAGIQALTWIWVLLLAFVGAAPASAYGGLAAAGLGPILTLLLTAAVVGIGWIGWWQPTRAVVWEAWQAGHVWWATAWRPAAPAGAALTRIGGAVGDRAAPMAERLGRQAQDLRDRAALAEAGGGEGAAVAQDLFLAASRLQARADAAAGIQAQAALAASLGERLQRWGQAPAGAPPSGLQDAADAHARLLSEEHRQHPFWDPAGWALKAAGAGGKPGPGGSRPQPKSGRPADASGPEGQAPAAESDAGQWAALADGGIRLQAATEDQALALQQGLEAAWDRMGLTPDPQALWARLAAKGPGGQASPLDQALDQAVRQEWIGQADRWVDAQGRRLPESAPEVQQWQSARKAALRQAWETALPEVWRREAARPLAQVQGTGVRLLPAAGADLPAAAVDAARGAQPPDRIRRLRDGVWEEWRSDANEWVALPHVPPTGEPARVPAPDRQQMQQRWLAALARADRPDMAPPPGGGPAAEEDR